jgi:hypothetical protein
MADLIPLCQGGQEQIQDWSRSFCKEPDRVEWQSEHVYCTSAHNALSSRMMVDKLTTLLAKDSE